MKTIEQIANEYFSDSGLKSKDYAMIYTDTSSVYDIMVLVAEAHAQQCCDEQINACYINADIHFDEAGMMDNYIRTDCVAVDKQSILSTPNVAENK